MGDWVQKSITPWLNIAFSPAEKQDLFVYILCCSMFNPNEVRHSFVLLVRSTGGAHRALVPPGLWQGNMASSCAAAENRTESWATSQNFDRALLKGHTPKTHVICGWMMLNDVECSSPRGTSLVEQFRATKSSFLGLNLAICWILLGQNHLWTSDWWLQIESLRTSDLSSLGRFIYIHSDLSGIFVHVEMHLLLLHPRHICIAAAWSSTNVGRTGDMTQPHIFKQPAGYNMAKTTLDHNFSVTKGQLPLLTSCQIGKCKNKYGQCLSGQSASEMSKHKLSLESWDRS